MKLVNAEEVRQIFDYEVAQGATDLFDAFDSAIENATAVDAAPVVRCKDCEKWHTPDCIMSDGLMEAEDNDFCSYGERRAET